MGNLFTLRDEVPINGLSSLADEFGPIYKLSFPGVSGGYDMVVISSMKLLEEISDEKRFHKVVSAGLDRLNEDGPRGLFSSRSEIDPDWGQAHRVLVPAFGPLSIIDMFDEMHDIASQLILKWARKGPDFRIPVTEDFTRLTLDTIALCAMGYRFNSFYQEDMSRTSRQCSTPSAPPTDLIHSCASSRTASQASSRNSYKRTERL